MAFFGFMHKPIFIMPQLPQNVLQTSKAVKSDPKTILLLTRLTKSIIKILAESRVYFSVIVKTNI